MISWGPATSLCSAVVFLSAAALRAHVFHFRNAEDAARCSIVMFFDDFVFAPKFFGDDMSGVVPARHVAVAPLLMCTSEGGGVY